ncbi:hypothetical protein VTK73DRAFT_1683 [Phialemonium thermophilum]|uniref:Alcohol acetyltransferase n=1 Tax=Phialemonium thermophilum TaxID=223376 RepID=A0ABR3VT51_9PEZI
MQEGSVIRPLGRMETYSTTRHWMGHYQCVGNTCRYVVPRSRLVGSSPRNVVTDALAAVVLKLPALQVGLADEDTQKPYFVQRSSLDLATHLEWRVVDEPDEERYTRTLLEALARQHETSWPDVLHEQPWKLIVFEDARQGEGEPGSSLTLDMMFAVHHALSDGKSTVVFHTQLLRALNHHPPSPSLTSQMTGSVLRLQSPSILVPSQEELIDFRVSTRFLLGSLWQEFAPSFLRRQPPAVPWTGGPVRAERSVRIRLLEFSAEQVGRLRTLARSHGVTITPLIHSLVAFSLSRRLPEAQAPAFAADTVISLRSWVDEGRLPESVRPLADSMTDLVTVCAHSFDPQLLAEVRAAGAHTAALPRTLLWDVARTIGEQVKEKVASLPNDDVCGLLAWVDWAKRARGLVGGPRERTWELSNLGSNPGTDATMENPGEPQWKITRSVFTQSAHVIGPAFCVNTSGIDRADFTLTLTWQEGTVGDELMEGMARDLDEWISELCRE